MTNTETIILLIEVGVIALYALVMLVKALR
jgi:hypothetical protein